MKLTLLAVLALLVTVMMTGVVADSCRKQGNSCSRHSQCCGNICHKNAGVRTPVCK
ncbi:conotoxin Cal6.33-like [Leptopilina boulardi]|uniref:conotoxin Cal6.33-like n=1 Tax=Leptopilina boulardi TaxID=63433 RepID=UPI0021F53ECC|nr:conotoxin Cal6.33-like [Leptopilina boulardi]